MKTTKLVSQLSSFSADELKGFEKFINSSFFTSNKRIPIFFDAIKKFYPSFDQSSFTPETIFKKVYPGKKFNEKTFKYLQTELIKLSELYIAYIGSAKNKLSSEYIRLKEFHKRKLDNEFNKSVSIFENLLGKETKVNSEFYYYNYLLEKEKRLYYEKKFLLGKRGDFFEGLTEEMNKFVSYFIYKMLKYYANSRNLENHLKYNSVYLYKNEVMEYAKLKLINEDPVISAFYHLNMMYEKDDIAIYFELRKLVSSNYSKFDETDAILLYTELSNFAKIKYLAGNNELNAENFDLLKEMLQLEIYPKENNYMTEQTYINYVSVGLLENEVEWVTEFIQKNASKLAPERKSNAYNYCMGLLMFNKKELDEAMVYFNKVLTKDYIYYLRIKKNLVMIFFEKMDYESILVHIDSFRHYLSFNTAIPEYISGRFIKFLNYMQRLVKAIENEDEFELMNIRKEIINLTDLENKTWMVKRIDMLTKSDVTS